MKLLVVKPMTSGIYTDDTTTFCEGFKKYFKDIELIEQTGYYFFGKIELPEYDKTKIDNIDVIWVPYEGLLPCAFKIKEDFPKAKIVGHLEVFPPGRISVEAAESYWFLNATPPIASDSQYYKWWSDYRLYCDLLYKCDYFTISCHEQLYKMEKLSGIIKKKHYKIKPYPLNFDMFESFKKPEIEQKRQILTVSNLAPHKRIHHVIAALSMLKDPPKYVIVGDWKGRETLEAYAKQCNVNVEFKGRVSDEAKAILIQESMFCVNPWAILPVCEAAFYKKPAISYCDHFLKERMGDLPVYCRNNDIEDLAKTIEYMSNNPTFCVFKGNKANTMLMSGKTHTHSQFKACMIMKEIFNKVLK
jgi:glycosyltransferase involved in cell wall biosynthesis